MKQVGLYIEKDRFTAAVVQRQFGKTELVDSVTVAFASEAELVAALRESSRAWAGCRIVSALPGRLFSQRVFRLPVNDRKRIEKVLPFEVEDTVPFGIDGVIIDHLVLADGGKAKGSEATVLCMLLPKAALRRHLDLLAGAGIDPVAVIPTFAGLASVAALMPAGPASVVAGGGDLCFIKGGSVAALRSAASASTAGPLHVLQGVETEMGERVEKAILLDADERFRTVFAEAGLAVEAVTPELGGKRAADAVSLGAALAGDVNFRRGEFAFHHADEGARKRKRAIIIAAAVAALLLCVNLGVKFSLVQAGYNKVDGQIKEIYRQTFPDAKSSGDPLRQMRDKVAEAKKRFGVLGGGVSALDIMKTVTDGVPKEIRAAFVDFSLEDDKLRLQGEAASFEAVDKIKAELQKSPLFADVAVSDTRMGVDNKVKFRMDIRVKQGK